MTCDCHKLIPGANGSMLRNHDLAVVHLVRLLKVNNGVDEAIDRHFAKSANTVKVKVIK